MQRRFSALAMAATGAIHSWLSSLRLVIPVEALIYRPEKHYMRGPRRK
jgi:hypothetical protein